MEEQSKTANNEENEDLDDDYFIVPVDKEIVEGWARSLKEFPRFIFLHVIVLSISFTTKH